MTTVHFISMVFPALFWLFDWSCPERLISVRMVSWNMSGVINIAVLPPGACPETPNPTVFFILTWQRMYGALTRSWWIMPHSWVSITGGDIGGHPAWSLSGPWWWLELSAHNSYPHFSTDRIWWLFSTHPKIIKHLYNQICELLTWRNHPAGWDYSKPPPISTAVPCWRQGLKSLSIWHVLEHSSHAVRPLHRLDALASSCQWWDAP